MLPSVHAHCAHEFQHTVPTPTFDRDMLSCSPSQQVATPAELQEKFILDGAGLLKYAGLDAFFGGLERRVGAPKPHVFEAMKAEHCESADSKLDFTTSNYDVTTTSETEWRFVAEPNNSPSNGNWPAESTISKALAEEAEGLRKGEGRAQLSLAALALLESGAKPRKPMPLADLRMLQEEKNAELSLIKEKELIKEELVAARLCAFCRYT